MKDLTYKDINPFMDHQSYHIFFTNLANPLKIGIMLSLIKTEKNVTKISKELNVEQSKVSHALTSLKKCNIVEAKQKGKERIYSLNKKTIVPILKILNKHSNFYCNYKCCANDCENKKEKSGEIKQEIFKIKMERKKIERNISG